MEQKAYSLDATTRKKIFKSLWIALIALQNALIKKYGDKKETFLDRDEITDWINEWKDERVNELAENNEKQFISYKTLSGDASGSVAFPSDFKKVQKVEMDYGGNESSKVRSRRIDLEDIDDTNITYDEALPRWAFNNYNLVHRPKGTSSLRIYLTQVYHPADLSADSDALPKPIRFYTGNLMDWLMHKAHEKDGKEEKATYYFNKYLAGAEKMIEHKNNIRGSGES